MYNVFKLSLSNSLNFNHLLQYSTQKKPPCWEQIIDPLLLSNESYTKYQFIYQLKNLMESERDPDYYIASAIVGAAKI